MRTAGLRLFTTSAIVGEIYTYMRSRDGYGVSRALVRSLAESRVTAIHQLDEVFDSAIWHVIDEFAGVPMSYADASLVVLGRRLRIQKVFSFDDDLRAAGLELVPAES